MRSYKEILSEVTKQGKSNEVDGETKKRWIKEFKTHKKHQSSLFKWEIGDEFTLLRNGAKGILIGYDERETNPYVVLGGSLIYLYSRQDLSNADPKTIKKTRSSMLKIILNPK